LQSFNRRIFPSSVMVPQLTFLMILNFR